MNKQRRKRLAKSYDLIDEAMEIIALHRNGDDLDEVMRQDQDYQ